MSIHFGAIRQLAFVVPDIDTAITHWSGTLGIGPFFVMRRIQFEAYQFRGRNGPSPVITIALAFSGELQVELIQQHDDVPSVFLKKRDQGPATGFHHVSSWVTKQDYDERVTALQSRGATIVQQGVLARSNIRLSYWDTQTADVPVIFEISDAVDPTHAGRMKRMKGAAATWDGSKSVIDVPT